MAGRGTAAKPLQLLDDTAEEDGDLDDNDDNDDNDDDEEEEEEPTKRQKTKGHHVHCNINFVKDTPYYMLAGSTMKHWASAKAQDPSPPVPSSRRDSCTPGDYLLIAGKDITLKSSGSNYTTTTFRPEEELILTNE